MQAFYDKILTWVLHWIEATPTWRKLADAIVVSIVALLAGSLHIAYKSEGDFRRVALASLSRMPVLDRDSVRRRVPEMFAALKDFDAKLVAVFEVDLSANVSTLIAFEGEGGPRANFEKMIGHYQKRTFISGDLHAVGLMAMGELMAGNKVVCADPIDLEDTTLFVPIPDRAGAFLAGFIVVVWDGKLSATESFEINQGKLICSEYAGRFSSN